MEETPLVKISKFLAANNCLLRTFGCNVSSTCARRASCFQSLIMLRVWLPLVTACAETTATTCFIVYRLSSNVLGGISFSSSVSGLDESSLLGKILFLVEIKCVGCFC